MTPLAIGLIVAGAILVWAGITGQDIGAAFRDILTGSNEHSDNTTE